MFFCFSLFLGGLPSCGQSKDAEREMMSARLRFSPEPVENEHSLDTEGRSRAPLDNVDQRSFLLVYLFACQNSTSRLPTTSWLIGQLF